ncbi:metallophosphoesterase family protein [Actinomarinicola tropica]|uniref:Nuclease SbcCD subunit D n=1 Tax=Actinomarinicola tropica TaxID=2789776 RepID=A0A5Q2RRD4_9ACTN|nr:exonuclease SbcCD subunit D [Actinomarinicola tropica]
MRFVHSADWQLGMTRHFLDEEAQAQFDQARIDAIARMGEVARAQGAEFVVVSGDVFETNHVARRVVVRALEAMAAAEVPFFLLPGNHDPLDASSVMRSATFRAHRPANVHVLDGGVVQVRPGVEVVAAPWTTKRPLGDLCRAACQGLAPDGAVRVLVGHGAVDVLSPDAADPALVRLADLEAALDAGVIHYVALGDRHSTTSVGRSGRVWYAGAPEPTAYDEVDPGNVLVVELDAGHVAVEPVQVGTWRFLRHAASLDGPDDVDVLARWLGALPGKERTIVKLSFVGTLSLAAASRLDEVLDHHRDLFAALETWERRTDLAVLPDAADLDDLGLAGYAAQALADLQQVAATDADPTAARDALGLLYRLARPA